MGMRTDGDRSLESKRAGKMGGENQGKEKDELSGTWNPTLARLNASVRRVIDLVVRNASVVALILYITGSFGALLALSNAGRPGGLDEKAFQLSVASPQLGATKAADIMRMYHTQKDLPSDSMVGDAQRMWNECEKQWHPSAGRRHGLVWYDGGNNVVYDVIEATRTDATESLMLVIPYHPRLASSRIGMAVGHGLGWYLQEQEWLAKNVVIAYIDASKSSSGVEKSLEAFLSSVMDRRIGRILQAVVLDITRVGVEAKDQAVSSVPSASLKVHGWDGRLPNLDLFVATRQLAETHFASREKITVHGASTPKDSAWNKGWALLRFFLHHGLGISDGVHGALLDRGIDALTVELSYQANNAHLIGVLQMSEGLVRGLNNLHERLHHATGLYALGGAGLVIDIGMYTVCPVLLTLACALKAHQLSNADHIAGNRYLTWNQAVRWTVGIACGAVALYINGRLVARHGFAGRTLPSMEVLKLSAIAFGRIAVLGASISECFVVRADGNREDGNRVDVDCGGATQARCLLRRYATVAWALCGASVVLTLYRWSLAWLMLTVCLPLIVTVD